MFLHNPVYPLPQGAFLYMPMEAITMFQVQVLFPNGNNGNYWAE